MNSETKNTSTGSVQVCQNCKKDFIIDDFDLAFYKRMKVPLPLVCSSCRFKMRAVWRNETSLYTTRKCDLCGKVIVSMYNPKSSYKVFCPKCWHSDSWDPLSYAQDFDPQIPFFDQLGSLLQKVPKKGLYITTNTGPNINSDYANTSGGLKNCYFVFNSGSLEDTLYSRGLFGCKEVVDGYFGIKNQTCYETVNVEQSSGVIYGQNCTGCLNCAFIRDCNGCTDCFGCVNLRNKSRYFFNEQLSKEEYEEKIKNMLGSYSNWCKTIEEFKKFSLQFPFRNSIQNKTVDCTGSYIFESKGLKNCFEAVNCENCKDGFSIKFTKDSSGVTGYGYQSELLLECTSVGYANRVIGSFAVDNGQNIEYCVATNYSHDCIGCDGIQKKSYCILNKQYSQEEYERIYAQIISELTAKNIYGIMLPLKLSPFAYNETIAADNAPLTRENVLNEGFKWEEDVQMTVGKETLRSNDIPDSTTEVQDSIVSEILSCISCGRNYRIISQELSFYRKLSLPVPRNCFYCRHRDRIHRRGSFKFFTRPCAKCTKETNTNLTEEMAPIMYCESCYQKEVV